MEKTILNKPKRIIISGGHLTPALAVARVLKKKDWEILFVGRKYSLEGEKIPSVESRIIPQNQIRFVSIKTGRLQRRFTVQTIPSLLKIPLGFFQALFWVWKFKPNIFLSFGGYIAAPLSLASWLCQVPILSHVQSVKPGLADLFVGFFSQKICLSWPQTKKYFPHRQTIITGNPLRNQVTQFLRISPQGFEKIKPNWLPSLSANLLVIYLTGGSLGSTSLNQIFKESFPKLKKYFLIHQCGDKDFSRMGKFRHRLKPKERKHYQLKNLFSGPEVGAILKRADLIIGRSGANTLAEIAAFRKPAIFIPLPWAGDNEQTANALELVKLGTAKILPQSKLSAESFVSSIKETLVEIEKLKKAAQKSKKLFHPRAADLIVAELESYVT